jgi:hypothetical protein
MLEHSSDAASFEDTFMASFRVSFSDIFGNMHTHDLKEGGDSIPVTRENCQVSKFSTPLNIFFEETTCIIHDDNSNIIVLIFAGVC